jgi:hypothetical protein
MSRPEDALETARRGAARRRGEYGPVEPTRLGPPYAQIDGLLSAWAVPDISAYEIRSVRRFGAPITWFKRLLVRFLYQFHAQLVADQSRFNALALDHVHRLEARVVELERQLGAEDEEEPDAFEDDWA